MQLGGFSHEKFNGTHTHHVEIPSAHSYFARVYIVRLTLYYTEIFILIMHTYMQCSKSSLVSIVECPVTTLAATASVATAMK